MIKTAACKKCGNEFTYDFKYVLRKLCDKCNPTNKHLYTCECRNCGETFYSLRENAQDCSKECKNQWVNEHKKKFEMTCPVCGNKYTTYNKNMTTCKDKICIKAYKEIIENRPFTDDTEWIILFLINRGQSLFEIAKFLNRAFEQIENVYMKRVIL
jgi:hypothetical protein